MNGFEDREPVLPPMYLADAMAALNGYGAVMVALREVEVNGGKGQTLDLPLFDPLFSVLGPQAANHKLTGEVKVRSGSRSTNAAPRNVYQTRDGHWVCLSASTHGMAERVLVKIGRPELVKEPGFSTNIQRARNGVERDQIMRRCVPADAQERRLPLDHRRRQGGVPDLHPGLVADGDRAPDAAARREAPRPPHPPRPPQTRRP